MMNIWQTLPKKWNSAKKYFPRQIFNEFGLILGSLGEPRNTKNQKKRKPKKKKKFRRQKNTPKTEKKKKALI